MRTYKILLIATALTIVLVSNTHASAAWQEPVQPAIPTASEVIAAINQYRTQNGLTALTSVGLLSTLAQNQADYQASIGTITHTGPGGTTPQDRAASAGYGDGSFFYFSEIIYGGWNATTSDAIAWWKNSSLHNSIMLDTDYTEIGAGVATDGTTVYFTAELGGPSGDSSSSTGSTGSTGEGSSGESESPTQGVIPAVPVVKATPGPDGSIVHIVRQGQTLWTIAAVYEVELVKLYELNDMNQYSYVFPGDEVIVQPPLTPAELSATPPSTPTPQPDSPGPTPKKVLGTPFSLVIQQSQATEAVLSTEMPSPTPEKTPEVTGQGFLDSNSTAVSMIVLALVILIGVIAASSFMQPKPNRPDKDDLLD